MLVCVALRLTTRAVVFDSAGLPGPPLPTDSRLRHVCRASSFVASSRPALFLVLPRDLRRILPLYVPSPDYFEVSSLCLRFTEDGQQRCLSSNCSSYAAAVGKWLRLSISSYAVRDRLDAPDVLYSVRVDLQVPDRLCSHSLSSVPLQASPLDQRRRRHRLWITRLLWNCRSSRVTPFLPVWLFATLVAPVLCLGCSPSMSGLFELSRLVSSRRSFEAVSSSVVSPFPSFGIATSRVLGSFLWSGAVHERCGHFP